MEHTGAKVGTIGPANQDAVRMGQPESHRQLPERHRRQLPRQPGGQIPAHRAAALPQEAICGDPVVLGHGRQDRPVIERIGVEPSGEITPRESGLTSLGCLRTRPSEQLAWETEQMTAACLLVRSPASYARQLQTNIVQVVRLRPTGFREGP